MTTSVSPGRAWYAVGLLTTIYIVSFIDRSILTLLVGPIRDDLGISDSQFSLLHGLAFAVFYTLLGIPVARLADRHSRRLVIGIGMVLWSAMTALGGLSRSFSQLFLARVGVGVGEAALSPAAYTLMADMFDSRRLGRATGIYGAGVYLGTGVSLTAGGWLIDRLTASGPMTLPIVGTIAPWQQLLILAGLPGLLLAALVVTLPDPPRQARAAPHDATGLFDYIRRDAYFLTTLIAGAAFIAIVFNGYLGWGAEFFVREHGWSKTRTGLALGTLIVVAGSAGVISGGLLTDRAVRQGDAYPPLKAAVMGAVGLLPWPFLATTTGSATLSLVLYAPLIFFASLVFTPVVVVIQTRSPVRLRAQVSAVYLFVANLVGIGFGTTAMALVSDFALGGNRLGLAMALVGCASTVAGLAAFVLCRRKVLREAAT